MRTYGKVDTAIWQNRKVRQLTEGARFLYVYLIACPHGNSLGCFVLPREYIQADMQADPAMVDARLAELERAGLIERDPETGLTRIIGWWGHNTVENPNVAKAAMLALSRLPQSAVVGRLVADMISLGNKFLTPHLEALETSSETSSETSFETSFETPSETSFETQSQSQSQNQNQSQNITPSDEGEGIAEGDTPAPSPERAVQVWNMTAGLVLPKVLKLTPQRRAKLTKRLREDFPSLAAWSAYCQRIAASPFLAGDNRREWKADFDWCLEPRNVAKIIEGRYDPAPDQPDPGSPADVLALMRKKRAERRTPKEDPK